MSNYVCRLYDTFDNATFYYIAFDDKASAKSYARHFRAGDGAAVYETSVTVPLNKRICGGIYFIRLEREN